MKIGKYRHYKGKYYHVVGLAQNTETREKMVIYKPLYPCPDLLEEYGNDPCFVRPFTMFTENIESVGKRVPRFEYVGELP